MFIGNVLKCRPPGNRDPLESDSSLASDAISTIYGTSRKPATGEVRRGSWDVLPIFKLLQENGGVADIEAYRVFNMGIGMVLIVDPDFVAAVQKTAAKCKIKSYLIGGIRRGPCEVQME